MHPTTPLRLLAVMTVLLLLFSAVVVTATEDRPTLADEHKCGYEQLMQYRNATPTGITLKYEDPDTGAAVYESVSRSSSGTYESIRIGVFFDDLDDSSKYCSSASGTAPDFQGGTIACSADTVLTDAKKTTLKTKLIPEAIQLHVDRLKVNPLTSAIKVPATGLGTVCGSFSVPASHKATGVTGYDFVIYVSAAPTSGNTIAWATTCAYLTDDEGTVGRPVIGVTNISPAYISTAHATVRVVAHEILHALGFSQGFFDASGIYNTATVRQKTSVPVITSSKVVSAAKEHYGCDSLTNMEIEDGGGSGTAGSHWKRRNAKDELMAGVSSHGFYTALTIAAMEDLGYYQGDYSKAEEMSWGKNAGCKLITDMCMTSSVSLDQSMFCMDGDFICTSDRDAVGMCYTASATLPSWAANYGLFNNVDTMDYCPYVLQYAQTICANGQLQYVPDSMFGDSSRCLDVSSGAAVCAAITCSASTYTVQFATGDAVACPPGNTVTIPGTSRTATCPPFMEVCNMQTPETDAPETDAPETNAPETDAPETDAPQGALTMAATGCTSVLFVLLGVLLSTLV